MKHHLRYRDLYRQDLPIELIRKCIILKTLNDVKDPMWSSTLSVIPKIQSVYYMGKILVCYAFLNTSSTKACRAIFCSSEFLSVPMNWSISLPFFTKKKHGAKLTFHAKAASIAFSISTFKNTTFGYFAAKLE